MSKFSPQLVERLQKHFAEKHNAQVSNEEAQEYLDSLADLYLLVVGRRVGAAAHLRGVRLTTPSYTCNSGHLKRKYEEQ